MRINKITQDDIAKALNLSRNTVSKALNDNPVITEKTRELVVRTALEMGYKNISDDIIKQRIYNSNQIMGTIALLTQEDAISGSSYWKNVIRGIETSLRSLNYNIALSIITQDDFANNNIPSIIITKSCQGILTQGVLPANYYKKLKTFNIPIVSMDIANEFISPNMICDVVATHSTNAVKQIVNNLIENGHRKIGFIGDIYCCKGYYERWRGYVEAFSENNLEIDKSICKTESRNDHFFDGKKFPAILSEIVNKVSAIVCVNDCLAIFVVRELINLGIRVPEDICVAGFDNIDENKFLPVGLTSVDYGKYEMGFIAGEQIAWRIKNPDRSYKTIKIETTPIFNESTNKKLN